MATLIPVVGNIQEVSPREGEAFTLTELQTVVGGYIEALRCADGRVMFLNEDGKRLGLLLNVRATELMEGRLAYLDDYIVGDVILCTLKEAGEETEGSGG